MKFTQVVLQFFVIQVVFMARIIPSPAIYRSLATSITMIMFAITKALMSQQTSHTKTISTLKQVKQLLWIICLAGTIFTVNIVRLNVLVYGFVSYGKEYSHTPPSIQSLIGPIIDLSLYVFMCILMYKNCFKQHLQTKVRFIILTIHHIYICWSYSFMLILSFLTENSSAVIFVICMLIYNLPLPVVFAKAAFSVSKLNDIWSLEKMTSKELCCIPNLLFVIVVLTFLGFNLIMVLYSLHVFPTFYA